MPGGLPLLLRIIGIRNNTISQDNASERIQDVLSEVSSAYSDTQKPTSDNILLKPTSEAGHALWRYACAKSDSERAEVDLSALNDTQRDWLLMLSDADLRRLASAGIDACTRAAAGKRSGIGGLPAMRDVEQDSYELATPLAERINAYRSPAFA